MAPSLFFLSVQNLSPLHAPSVLNRGRGLDVLRGALVVVVVAAASVVVVRGGTNLPEEEEVEGRRR